MATDKNTLKSWFLTGLKPLQTQFHAWLDSYWHKDEAIPQSAVSNLTNTLAAKTENAQFNAHKNDETAHQALFDLKEDKTQKGVPNGYAPLDEFNRLAAGFLNIVDDLVTGGSTALASAETVKTLKGQIDAINLILTSDDVNLDTVQELVDAIKEVETSLETILVNDLTTGGVTKALTAEMGKSLKVLVDSLTTTVNGKQAILTDANLGAFENLLPTVTAIDDTDKVPFLIGVLRRTMSWADFKALFKTINGVSIFGAGDITNDPAQITITTTTSITTDSLGNAGKSQKGKNVIIDNGVNVINITVNGGTDFNASYVKHGTGAVTFVQGAGRTLTLVDTTNVLDGAVGSSANISSVGTIDYLRISNA